MRIEFPGLYDLQINGYAGVDFNDPDNAPEQIRFAGERLRADGVTRYLPTLITSSFESFSRSARTLLASGEPGIAGLHMEGPYISPADGSRGAHPREHVRPATPDDWKRRQEAAGGQIRLVTLAPEVEGALALIEHLTETGVRVAIGHTAAAPEEIRDAIRAGATLSTHLGNGCTAMLPRHPNFIWEQLAADELYASFIADGHHLPPATVKAMVRAKGLARTILVTDATAAAGCQPGSYRIGGLRVELGADGRVSVPGESHLGGSALRLREAVANAVRFAGLTIDEALALASTAPANYLGEKTAGRVTARWEAETKTLEVETVEVD